MTTFDPTPIMNASDKHIIQHLLQLVNAKPNGDLYLDLEHALFGMPTTILHGILTSLLVLFQLVLTITRFKVLMVFNHSNSCMLVSYAF